MTTMTPNETSPDQAVEAVAVTQADRDAAAEYMRLFPDLRLPEAFARHRLSAIPTPPPADHTDLIARLRSIIRLYVDPFQVAPDDLGLVDACASADALQAHASPRELELGKADRNNALLLASICQKVRHSSVSVAERDDALRDAAEMLRVIARTALELG